jgi:type IV secretion system protein VirB1
MIDFSNLIHDCAGSVPAAVVEAIVRTESGFDPLALHVNANARLQSQPKTKAQAAAWAEWLIRRGYSVDMGLMQINSGNLLSLNLTPVGAFDPCQNIRAGVAILTAQYGRALREHGPIPGPSPLLQAISAYNTGTFRGGFRNGYVGKVVMNLRYGRPAPILDLTCLLTRCSAPAAEPVHSDPYTADSAVAGFGGSYVTLPP